MPQPSTYQTDAVIVGGGLAGLSAALELLDRGLRVLIVDRESRERFGGQAKDSFGGIFIVDSPEQRRAGIRDSAEQALRDWHSYAQFDPGDDWPRAWASRYVERSRADVYDWLRQRGVSFFPVVHWVERGLDVPGNSVPRFHMVWGTGHGLITALLGHLREHPHRDRLQVLFRHRVERLTTEGGRVVGCEGIDELTREPFTVRADAVIVASGGLNGDLQRVRREWYKPWGAAPEQLLNGSHPSADGKLHDVVSELGGQVTHLDRMWNYAAGVQHPTPRWPMHGLSLVPPRSALWLDYRGRRFGPRAMMTSYDTRYLVEQVCKQERAYSWQVMNWRIASKELAVSGSEFNDAIRNKNLPGFLATLLLGNPGFVRHMRDFCPDVVTGRSVPELVERMNALTGEGLVEASALEAEIRQYDAAVAQGRPYADDQLRRLDELRQYRGDRVRICKNSRILDPKAMPLIAIRLSVLSRKSLGGIQTDLDSRVLCASGEPIPGLYAAGEAAGFGGGGVHGHRTLEGTLLGSCILTGRAAARAIAGNA